MNKLCFVCERPFVDDQSIVAIVEAKYKQLDSTVNFAITRPSECLEIMHYDCYDPHSVQEIYGPKV